MRVRHINQHVFADFPEKLRRSFQPVSEQAEVKTDIVILNGFPLTVHTEQLTVCIDIGNLFTSYQSAFILIEVVKVLVHLVTMGTVTAGVGDFANFIFGCAFVVPAGLIYRFHHKKSRVHAVAGMAVGTVLTAILACFINAFVLLPAYGKAFGMPIETFIQMGSAVHSSVNGLLTFALLIIAPFNIFKYAVTSLIVFVIYKKIRVVLKGD